MTYEQFIEPKTAKLAKQAGFDWECPTFYAETFDYINQDTTGKFEFRRDDNLRYQNPNDDRNSFVNHKGTLLEYKFEMYSAPTQSVLQRWLREAKNIHIQIMFDSSINVNKYYAIIKIKDTYHDFLMKDNHVAYFNTYEDCLEAGLQKCLTILIKKL